jgi:hypothetical protein
MQHRLQGAPPVAAALPMPADPQPAGSAGAAAPAAGTEAAAHTVGAFAPEVSVKPMAGAGAHKISPIAEPTAEAAEARTLAIETAPGQGPQGAAAGGGNQISPIAEPTVEAVLGQGAQAAAAGGGVAAAPAAGENPNPVAPVATAANSSLVTATGDSFDLPKPHDASHELAAGEVGAFRLSACALAPGSRQSYRQHRLHKRVTLHNSGRELPIVCAVQGASSAGDGQGHKGTQAGAPVVEATTQSPTAPANDNGGAAQLAAAPADATQRSEIQVRCSITL